MTDWNFGISEEMAEGALLEQIKTLHKKFNAHKKQDGEFTAREYRRINSLGYDKARTELQNAVDAGFITRRRVGRVDYYKVVVSGTERD